MANILNVSKQMYDVFIDSDDIPGQIIGAVVMIAGSILFLSTIVLSFASYLTLVLDLIIITSIVDVKNSIENGVNKNNHRIQDVIKRINWLNITVLILSVVRLFIQYRIEDNDTVRAISIAMSVSTLFISLWSIYLVSTLEENPDADRNIIESNVKQLKNAILPNVLEILVNVIVIILIFMSILVF